MQIGSLRGSGRINPSTLAMEFDLPLGSYSGRGINIPISISYSSKLWRMESIGSIDGGIVSGGCRSLIEAKYGENSASGWTTSLATPYIEYTGRDNLYYTNGFPLDNGLCVNAPPEPDNYAVYFRKLSIHLPSGETHELRADDLKVTFDRSSTCPPANGYSCDPNSYGLQYNWDRTFYAVDGSNIKYVEDSNTGTYRLLMPDGSYYDFESSLSNVGEATARKGIKFTDRNGNYTSYNNSSGVWTDTLGRTLTAPIGDSAPASPTTKTYMLPGTSGSYKFYWKQLKGNTAEESALTDFSQNLKYTGDKIAMVNNGNWTAHPEGTYLFGSNFKSYVKSSSSVFNPVVLTKIELPTGQSYKFSYDIYGRIEKLNYPTGGEEKFVYNVIAPLSPSAPHNSSDQANFGVTNRKVYPTAGQSANYEWNNSVTYSEPNGYKVSITSPDGTISQRILHRGNTARTGTVGNFGVENGLAGMPYEELNFSNTGRIVTRTLTSWTNTQLTYADWHPRVNSQQTFIYDDSGNKVSAFTKYEYEGNLNLIETPVLRNKTTEYAYVPVTGGDSQNSLPDPDGTPYPFPTPVPTPTPSTLTPVRISEATYLINDANIAQTVRDAYKNQNMIGLTTASVVKNGAGTIVSRSEMQYDVSGYSPGYRGNPTISRVWDSTKGVVTDTNAYISTSAKFDSYGNQYQSTDAKGNSTLTEYDATYHAYPVKVTTTVPDPNPTQNPDGQAHGSGSGFVTTATYDTVTGLPLTTTDANGLETRIAYDPVTLRPLNTKTFYQNNQVGSQAETIYHDEPNNYWVKNRSQIDTNKWAESITYFDGLGRAYKAEQIDSQGNIYVEKEFDAEGRIKRVTNPFRTGETKQWTMNVYDNSSRVIEVVLPDGGEGENRLRSFYIGNNRDYEAAHRSGGQKAQGHQ